MNFGKKERIVGVDITNAGKTRLVEEDYFNGAGGIKLGGKIAKSKGGIKKVAAKVLLELGKLVGSKKFDPTKFALIVE